MPKTVYLKNESITYILYNRILRHMAILYIYSIIFSNADNVPLHVTVHIYQGKLFELYTCLKLLLLIIKNVFGNSNPSQ